jgi:hypothetical protein
MCHFISLVTNGLTSKQVEDVLRENGRRARLADVTTLQKLMKTLELQFFTFVDECDCGTVLAHTAAGDAFDPSMQLRKFLAKGWTQQKAERALQAKQQSETKSKASSIDSYELWENIISGFLALKDCKEAGLMLHFYRGAPTDEEFSCVRKQIKRISMKDELLKIPENTLLMVSN